MKRIVICTLFVVLVLSCSISVLAADQTINGNRVLNYLDYVTAYDITYANDGWAYIAFPDLFTSEKNDINGYQMSNNGGRVWPLVIPNSDQPSSWVICNTPGGASNNVYLSLTNIPSGSRFQISAVCDFEYSNLNPQTEFFIWLNSGISYFDKDFNFIEDQVTEQRHFAIDADQRFVLPLELVLDIPENAVYCTLYSRANFAVGRSNDRLEQYHFEFQFQDPYLKIETSYTKIIVESIIQAKPPAGSGTIIDVDELESILNGATGDGKDMAEDLFHSATETISDYLGGLLFLGSVLTTFVSTSSFLSNLLTYSLSLGLFAFIVNAGISVANKDTSKSRRG